MTGGGEMNCAKQHRLLRFCTGTLWEVDEGSGASGDIPELGWQEASDNRDSRGDRETGQSQESLTSASTAVSPPQCPGVVVSLLLWFPVFLMLWHHGTLLTLEGLPFRGPANPWDNLLSNATPPNLEPTPSSPPPSTPGYYPPALITPGQVPDN